MTTSSRELRERESIAAFLCQLTGSGSHAPVRERERVRTSTPAGSQPIADSHEPVRITSDVIQTGKVSSEPSFSRSHGIGGMDELKLLVTECADELDRLPVGTFPVSGEQVRAHYRTLLRTAGLDVALVDARERYRVQCLECRVLPLPAAGGAK